MLGAELAAKSGAVGPVLIVEDDPDIRQALAELLEEAGYECILAEHGLDALGTLAQVTPSLLLVDLLMPVMNGVELIDHVRRDARLRNLPIIVMTAAGDEIFGVELESLNVRVLRKPIDIGDLSKMLAGESRASPELGGHA